MIHAPGVEGVGSSSIMRLYEPRKAEEIAKHCGVSKGMVHQVISTYNRFGVEAIETPGKGGRRHQYLTFSEEKEFLAPFFTQADQRKDCHGGPDPTRL